MSWIKMRSNLDTDPDVLAIAAATGLDELAVIGRLWKLWSWADQHSIDGNNVRVTEATLDRMASRPGFAAAMREADWLEGRDGSLSFPRFDRHNGQSAKKRAATQSRVAKHRVTHTALPPLSPLLSSESENLRIRLGNLFRRKPETAWSEKELAAFEKLLPIDPEALAAVERYYGEAIPTEKDYRRRDLQTLLNNWSGEVDRAVTRTKKCSASPSTPPKDLPERFRAWLLEQCRPEDREKVSTWKTFADLPRGSGLWDEWRREHQQAA